MMLLRISDDLAQFAHALCAHGWVLFFEQLFVGDGLRLNIFNRRQTTLAVIACKKRLCIATAINFDQLARQRDAILEAAIHAHAANRIVDMR